MNRSDTSLPHASSERLRGQALALVHDLPRAEVPRLVGVLAECLAQAQARLALPEPASGPAPLVATPTAGQRLSVRPEEAAKMLGLKASKVYDLLRAGQMPGRKVGKYWLVPMAALVEWQPKGVDRNLSNVYSLSLIHI